MFSNNNKIEFLYHNQQQHSLKFENSFYLHNADIYGIYSIYYLSKITKNHWHSLLSIEILTSNSIQPIYSIYFYWIKWYYLFFALKIYACQDLSNFTFVWLEKNPILKPFISYTWRSFGCSTNKVFISKLILINNALFWLQLNVVVNCFQWYINISLLPLLKKTCLK